MSVPKILQADNLNSPIYIEDENGNSYPVTAAQLQNNDPRLAIPIPGQRIKGKSETPHTSVIQPLVQGADIQAGAQQVGAQQVDRSVNQNNNPVLSVKNEYTPVFNLFKTKDAFYFFIDIPGVDKSSIAISVSDRRLTLEWNYIDVNSIFKNISKQKIVEQKNNLLRAKKFQNAYDLSVAIDESNVSADATTVPGILLITLPFRDKKETKVSVTVL